MSSELPLPHSGGTHLYVSLAGFHVRKYHVDMPAARAKSGGRLEHLATPSAILRGHIVIAVAVLHHRRRRTGNDNGPWLGQDGLQPDFARCSALGRDADTGDALLGFESEVGGISVRLRQMVVVSRETSKAAKRGWFSIGNAPLKGKRPSIGRLTPNDRISKNLLARSSGS